MSAPSPLLIGVAMKHGKYTKVPLKRERNRSKERTLSLENFIDKPLFPSLGNKPKTTYRAVRKLLTK